MKSFIVEFFLGYSLERLQIKAACAKAAAIKCHREVENRWQSFAEIIGIEEIA